VANFCQNFKDIKPNLRAPLPPKFHVGVSSVQAMCGNITAVPCVVNTKFPHHARTIYSKPRKDPGVNVQENNIVKLAIEHIMELPSIYPIHRVKVLIISSQIAFCGNPSNRFAPTSNRHIPFHDILIFFFL
jgi:hypothetical protein